MSEPNDPTAPPPDEPPASPFPESSLTPSQDTPASPPPPAPAEPPLDPSQSLWSAQAPPQEPAPAPPATTVGGMVGGDPLGGGGYAAPAPAPASDYPQGYTSPPPPGAAGPAYTPPPPMQSAFGSGAPAPGSFVLAGWWLRVGAALVDGFIITSIALIIMAPLGVGFFANRNGSSTGFFALIAALFVAMLVIAVVALAYAPLMMARTNGKTIGRMATGIRVVRANGQPITLGFAAIREVAVKALLVNAVAGGLTGGLAPLLDVLWPLWDDENRALHDMVVDTRTVMG